LLFLPATRVKNFALKSVKHEINLVWPIGEVDCSF